MPRTLITYFHDCDCVFYDDDDPQEVAGDQFAELEGHGCSNPTGHVFRTCCGATICLYCEEVAA